MDKPSLNIVRAADIAAHAQEFSHPWNPDSLLLGTRMKFTPVRFSPTLRASCVPAGKESYVYHSHQFEEEWIYVLSGRALALIDDVEYDVGPGDFIGFPAPSVAHHLRNPGPDDLVYLTGGENREYEVADFPKLGKRIIRRGNQLDVYDARDAQPFWPSDPPTR